MANILLLGSGTQAYAIVKNLATAGHRIIILGEKGNYADASRYVRKTILSRFETNSIEYLSLVKNVLREEKIDVVFPMGDATAEFLSRNKDVLSGFARFCSPDIASFLDGYDKNRLMELCRAKGYPHPKTSDLSKIDYRSAEELKEFPYPAILKPNRTTGGRGMVLINTHDELLRVYPEIQREYGDCHLQKYIPTGGRQVKIQMFLNNRGERIAHSALHKARWYPVRGGSSCCAVSTDEEKMVEVCGQILQDIKWVGFADFDLIEDPETQELLIMEINPRLPACIGAAIHAGIDWGEILLDGALGNPIRQYDYKTGTVLRHLGFDLLWFISSSRRFSSHPSWFHFIGKNIYYQDFDFFDQKPFWTGSWHNLKKIFDPSFRKAKNGAI